MHVIGHLEIESNLRWKQLAATFYFNGHELKKEEFEKEFFKLSNTEHIPSVGPEIDLIFSHLFKINRFTIKQLNKDG